ncbi:MAG TPA: hypothetical protein VMG98_05290 [Verrucomicrobiae bacterium]|nr:hypothetical protein [Verrucomicrobiae bacterium]
MKLPYRLGDSFALPLGNGATAAATIEACGRHTVDIAVAGLRLRVSDRALVLHRWKAQHRFTPSTTALRAYARDDKSTGWIGPAHAERIVATHLGIANLALPPLHIRAGEWRPEFPRDSRYLRIADRGFTLDPRELAQRYPLLEVLECSGVGLTSLEFPRTLRALRLARVTTPVDLRALAALPLHTLALEQLREVRGVEALANWTSLEQLEMLGFWQLELDDVMPLVQLQGLVRAEIDIGGRRKNVELYRRAAWAYPWPFELLVK